MIWIISSPADEGGPQAYAKELLLSRNCLVESLTAVSKSASDCYIQLFNSPRKLAVAITDSDMTTGVFTAAGHGFVTGDFTYQTGTSLLQALYYLRAVDANTFTLHLSRAQALANTDIVLPDADNETGVIDLASNISSPPVAEEYPLKAAASAPSNVVSFTNARFTRGLYVRAVTAQNGSTLIGADDVKFTPRYRTHPKTVPPDNAYES